MRREINSRIRCESERSAAFLFLKLYLLAQTPVPFDFRALGPLARMVQKEIKTPIVARFHCDCFAAMIESS